METSDGCSIYDSLMVVNNDCLIDTRYGGDGDEGSPIFSGNLLIN